MISRGIKLCLVLFFIVANCGCCVGRYCGTPSGYGCCSGPSPCAMSCDPKPIFNGSCLRRLMVVPYALMTRAVCGGGCGEIYWDEWASDPPYCCDPCDPCARWNGGGSCGMCCPPTNCCSQPCCSQPCCPKPCCPRPDCFPRPKCFTPCCPSPCNSCCTTNVCCESCGCDSQGGCDTHSSFTIPSCGCQTYHGAQLPNEYGRDSTRGAVIPQRSRGSRTERSVLRPTPAKQTTYRQYSVLPEYVTDEDILRRAGQLR